MVLKPPETLRDDSFHNLAAPCALTSLLPSPSFGTMAISRDIDIAAKYSWGWSCHCVGGWLWSYTGGCVWGLITGYASNLSLKQRLFSHTFPFQRRRGCFAGCWLLSTSLPWEGPVSSSHMSFFQVSSALYVPLPRPPRQPGECCSVRI